jgi:flavin-binding protein dodecin
MTGHVYKLIEITGSSERSSDDAIRNAISRASQSIRHIGWFEVMETRGHVQDGKVAHFQVTLKIGFRLDGDVAGAARDDAIPAPGTDALHEGP